MRLTTILAAFLIGTFPAVAATGTPPGQGPQLVDGAWLHGLSGGLNQRYAAGLTAAGSGQSTAAQIPAGYYLVEFDTVASSTGGYLPFCLPGTTLFIYNNGAQTLTVYPNPTNNPTTAAQDTINNTTSVSISSHAALKFGCAKAGVWFSE